VPVEKKGTNKLHICIDFRDLNKATPTYEYPMPITDFFVNTTSRRRIFSFLDGNVGLVTIKSLWSKRIFPKWLSYVQHL
jgi:hypothetical protein